MPKIPLSKIAIGALALGVLGSTAIYAQEKYSLKSPSGIAFSDFKGYEDWAVVSSARTDEVLEVIVANPIMIDAYKAGVTSVLRLSSAAASSTNSHSRNSSLF